MSTMSSHGGPCGACKFLRRKCVKNDCVFAPYFDPDQAGTTHFAAVHKVFGASNASKLLLRVPPHSRLDAVVSLCFEALSRVKDPVYGCVANILTLQQQVVNLQTELSNVHARISMLRCHYPEQDYPLSSIMDVCSPWSSCPKVLISSNYTTYSTIDEEATKIKQTTTPTLFCNNSNTLTSQDSTTDDLQMLLRDFLPAATLIDRSS